MARGSEDELGDKIRRLRDSVSDWEEDSKITVVVNQAPAAPAPPRSLPAPAKGALAVLQSVPERQRALVVVLLLALALAAAAHRLGLF